MVDGEVRTRDHYIHILWHHSNFYLAQGGHRLGTGLRSAIDVDHLYLQESDVPLHHSENGVTKGHPPPHPVRTRVCKKEI